jgi:hypothetical protein
MACSRHSASYGGGLRRTMLTLDGLLSLRMPFSAILGTGRYVTE